MRLYDICNPRTPRHHGKSQLLEDGGTVVAATPAYRWLVGQPLSRAQQRLAAYQAVLRARHGNCKPTARLLRQLLETAP